MSTASTKQAAAKEKIAPQHSSSLAETMTDPVRARETAWSGEISERAWRIASLAIISVAALLRLLWLELRPFHHDEGVNGYFLLRLIREGIYQYDPANYHGPTLYYFTLPFTALFGLESFALRLLPAVCGIGMVALVLCLRGRLGRIGALAAAALLAVSPGAVFQARYYIHETLFVLFTLGFLVAALRYKDTGRPRYALLAATSAALLFATKETAFITIGVFVIAALLTWIYTRLRRSHRKFFAKFFVEDKLNAERVEKSVSPPNVQYNVPDLLGAAALFLIINLLLYSSFFTYISGVKGALQTFAFWTRTGLSDFHGKPPDTYLRWLQAEEAPIYVLGLIGAVWAVLQGRNRFAIFTGLWAGGIIAAYSLVRYKTPWLSLNFVLPLAISSGYLLETIYQWQSRRVVAIASGVRLRAPAAVAYTLLCVALAFSWYQTREINFRHYDDESYPYVYAHTRREFFGLVEAIDQLARLSGAGDQTHIVITSNEYWPLPWYLRNYKRADFYNQIVPITPEHTIVISLETQLDGQDADPQVAERERELEATLREGYHRVGDYPLRPGVKLLLYVKRDLAILSR